MFQVQVILIFYNKHRINVLYQFAYFKGIEESLEVCNDDDVMPVVAAVSLKKDVACQTEVVTTIEVGCKTVKVDSACQMEMLEVKETCCETDLSGFDIIEMKKEIEEMRSRIYNLIEEIQQLRKQLDIHTLSKLALEENNHLLKFYTGAYHYKPFVIWIQESIIGVFEALFNLTSKYLSPGTKLSKFSAFMMIF